MAAKPFLGKLTLVTGGSSGIGLATAIKLSSIGADVWLLARDKSHLETARVKVQAAALNSDQRFGVLSADVTDASEVKAVLSDFIHTTGVPDLLVNSAGVAHPGYFELLDVEIFDWMINVNYLGTVYVTKAVVPGMMQRGSGHIVNISSIAGFLGVFGYTAYGASKYAVRGFSDVLRAEMKPHGVHISIVYPPDTDTPQLAYEDQFKPPETKEISGSAHAMAADQVADAILKGVARGRYTILPGLEGKFYYRLSSLVGDLVYPVMDMMVSQAQKKNHNNHHNS
jgi:3-dehydrosphinganine reductase